MTEAAPSVEHAEPTLRLRGVGRRFGGLLAVERRRSRRRSRRAARDSRTERRGKTTLFNVISGDLPPRAGRSRCSARTSRSVACAQARAKLGLARTYQQSRLFNGLTVEDSIYLSIVGVGGGHLRPVVLPRKDRRSASRRARLPRNASRSTTSSRRVVGSLSHGEHRQVALAMALAAEPKHPHARRAGVGAFAWRAAAPDRAAARARPQDHARSSSSTTWTSRSSWRRASR